MIVKTEAIALRTFPFSETSLVVSWLTANAGRVTTVIKGAQRPKSGFVGQIDVFYTCEILFYERDERELCILREASPLKRRNRFRVNWRACCLASYVTDLLYRVSPPGAHQPGLYRFLDDALDWIHEESGTPGLLIWLELKLLEQLGLAPRFQACTSCHRPLSGTIWFEIQSGGAQCTDCVHARHAATISVAPDVLAVLSAWQRSSLPSVARRTRITARQRQKTQDLVGRFVEHHLERSSASRTIALDLLQAEPP